MPVTDLPRLRDQTLCPSVKWLAEKLLPKLAGWMKARSKKSDGLETKWKAAPPNQLINEDKYSKLYRHLKEKYGRRMAEVSSNNYPKLFNFCNLIMKWSKRLCQLDKIDNTIWVGNQDTAKNMTCLRLVRALIQRDPLSYFVMAYFSYLNGFRETITKNWCSLFS